jgi:hypothetical protein
MNGNQKSVRDIVEQVESHQVVGSTVRKFATDEELGRIVTSPMNQGPNRRFLRNVAKAELSRRQHLANGTYPVPY